MVSALEQAGRGPSRRQWGPGREERIPKVSTVTRGVSDSPALSGGGATTSRRDDGSSSGDRFERSGVPAAEALVEAVERREQLLLLQARHGLGEGRGGDTSARQSTGRDNRLSRGHGGGRTGRRRRATRDGHGRFGGDSSSGGIGCAIYRHRLQVLHAHLGGDGLLGRLLRLRNCSNRRSILSL